MKTRSNLPALAFIVAVALSASACSPAGQRGKDHPVVSPVQIAPGSPLEPVVQPRPVELYYGEGDCAPTFANGMRGTCINNKPCNGFGVKDEKGEMKCDCFGVRGGCGEDLVCSVIRRTCVALSKAERLPRGQ